MLNSKIQLKVALTKEQIKADAAQMTLMIANMAKTISNNDPKKMERGKKYDRFFLFLK